jgi:hypothetical protein
MKMHGYHAVAFLPVTMLSAIPSYASTQCIAAVPCEIKVQKCAVSIAAELKRRLVHRLNPHPPPTHPDASFGHAS